MVVHRCEELGGKALFDKRPVDDELRLIGADLARLPLVDLLLQRLEISLHLIDADAEKIGQIQAAGVLVQHGSEVTFERKWRRTPIVIREALIYRWRSGFR